LNSSTGAWTPVLKSSGFNSVEATIPESKNKAFSSFKLIVATAANTTTASYALNVALVLGSKATPTSWIDRLKLVISELIQGEITVEQLEYLDPSGKVCIYLGDIEQSILKNPSHEDFEAVKNLCVKSKGLIWVTHGGAVDCQNLDASLSQGFLRTLRTEYAGKRAIAIDLDPETEPFSETSTSTIAAVFKKSFDYSQKGIPMDFEYAERNGTVNVPRFYKDIERNSLYFPDPAQPPAPKPGQFFQEGRPLRLQVGVPGLLDTLSFVDDLDALKELPDGFIEIEPKVFGVNFRDIMTAMGQLQSDFMGFECSGIVKKVSQAALESGLTVGDRVATLMKGHYSSVVRVPWTSAVRIPHTIGFEIAASLPMAYATAYVSLLEMARLEKGEKVLIHAAMGGVGQAAINLAKIAGAEIFATVGSTEKREALISQYGIPEDHIFSSRSTSFATGVRAATGGKGVDVVLNSLAGSLLQESFDCLAQFGRFVEIGKRDLELNNSLQMQTFTRNVSFYSLDLIQLEDHKGHIINRVMKEVIRLFDQGAISTAVPFTTYPLNEIGKPFRLMQAGKHMGRIVVTVEPDVLVPVIHYFLPDIQRKTETDKTQIIPRKPTARIDARSSYLVVGGLGGIGRSVCQWLAQRGAKNLIILSRSANAEKIRPFSEEMQQIGCKIYPVACDISDSTSMACALEACRNNMPPIRGIIQGAMVLQVWISHFVPTLISGC
jgi:NADPH:quinone reductase-like Zn-dependent oxidoreductase